MSKPLPTNQAAVKLMLRRVGENKEGFNQSQLKVMLQSIDRLAVVTGLYDVPLTPPAEPYDRNPTGKSSKEEPEVDKPLRPLSELLADMEKGVINGTANQNSK